MPAKPDATASASDSPLSVTRAPAPSPPAWVWVALVALAALAALYRSDDTDYWFHLAAGRSIVAHGIPTQENWCLASQGQAPWLSEWLFEVGLYSVHQLGGNAAVALWRVAWTAGAMALAVALLRVLGAASWSALLLSPLVIAVSRDRFQPRPEQIFLVLVLFALLQLERARQAGRDRTRWLVPAQVLWANVQGSWVFGPAIVGLYALAEWWQRLRQGARRGEPSRPAGPPETAAPAVGASASPAPPTSRFARARWWTALAVMVWAASAIVPRPLETLARPLRFVGDMVADPLTGSIDELRAWAWPQDRFEPFTALLLVCLVAAVIGGRRVWRASPALAVFSLGTLALGAMGFRFRGLAAWVAFAPLALAFTRTRPTWLGLARVLPAVGACAAGVFWLATARQFTPGIEPQWYSVPVRAVALADSARLDGPVVNTFHYGGYILWVRGERHLPLIDGRGYASYRFRDLYAMAHADPAMFDSLNDVWHFTHAIVEPPRDARDNFATNLARRLEWALVFYDDNGCLFVPWARQPEMAEQRAYRYFTPDFSAMAQMSEMALRDPGLQRRLEAEIKRARAESPFHARASLWLALQALARADGKTALTYLDEVERIAPATPGLALRQGLAYQLIGDHARARTFLRRALHNPDDRGEAEALLENLK